MTAKLNQPQSLEGSIPRAMRDIGRAYDLLALALLNPQLFGELSVAQWKACFLFSQVLAWALNCPDDRNAQSFEDHLTLLAGHLNGLGFGVPDCGWSERAAAKLAEGRGT